MPLDRLVNAATDLAVSIGPRSMLAALSDVYKALDDVDTHLWAQDLHDDDQVIIDIREVKSVLAEVQPVIARAEVRITDMRDAMNGI